MTLKELRSWCDYIGQRGSLNVGRRIEQATAGIMAILARALGNKTVKATDFMPHERQEQTGGLENLPIEEVRKIWLNQT